MNKKILQTFLITTSAFAGVTTLAVGFSSCQKEKQPTEEIKSDRCELECFSNHFNGPKTGCACETFKIRQNGRAIGNVVDWTVKNENRNGNFWIEENERSTDLDPEPSYSLHWKNLKSGPSYNVDISAQIPNGEIVKKTVTVSVVSEAIVGPAQLRGALDQAGRSLQSYILVDSNSQPIKGVTWSIKGNTADGKIKCEKCDGSEDDYRITWTSELNIGLYTLTIVATKDGNTWESQVRLIITNDYRITGSISFNVDNTGAGKSEAYQLWQDRRPSKHTAFKWAIKDRGADYTDKNISVENGVISWNGIRSSTSFLIVAMSTVDADRELASLLVSLKVSEQHAECTIGREAAGNSCNITGHIAKAGSEQLSFYDGAEKYTGAVDWSVICYGATEEQIHVDDNGKLIWDNTLERRQYIITVEAQAKNDSQKTARNLYVLDIDNLYSFEYDQTSFICASKQAGETDKTFTLKYDGEDVTDNVEYKVDVACDGKEVCDDKGVNFSYKDKKITWDEEIKEKSYWVKLTAKVGGKECAEVYVQIQAVASYIFGENTIRLAPGNVFPDQQYSLLLCGEEIKDGVTWGLKDDSDTEFTISNTGLLICKNDGKKPSTGTHDVTIVATCKGDVKELLVHINVVGKFSVEGQKNFECSASKDGSFEKPFTLKNDKGEVVSDAVWQFENPVDGVTIDKDTGTISWKASALVVGEKHDLYITVHSKNDSKVYYTYVDIKLDVIE